MKEEEEYSIVENQPNLVRDNYSKAIINTDKTAYEEYMNRKKNFLRKEEELNSLKNEVGELKDLVKTLIDKIGN